VHHDAVRDGIIRLSPSGLYSEASEILLAPSERTTSIGAQLRLAQSGGAVTGAPLSLSQSMLLVWPQLTGIIAATLVCFAVAYGVFMRQEIRS
jgi:ABC-2 type transport system permease protein